MAKAIPLITLDAEGNLSANAPLMLHIRLEELYSFSSSVYDCALVEELHNMRIAAKRLRYTMEVFATCFAEIQFAKSYDAVKKIQEQIGEIHDADVRIPVLTSFLERHSESRPEIETGVKSLLARQNSDRKRKFNTFVKTWEKYNRNGFKKQFLVMLSEPISASAAAPAAEQENVNVEESL